MLNQALILLIVICFLDLILGFVVLFKDYKNKINSSFFFLTLSAFFWMVSSYFEDELKNRELMVLFLKIDFASALFLAFFVLLFCLNISKIKIFHEKYFNIFILSIPVFFSILIFFTNLIISDYEIVSNNVINPIFGKLGGMYDLLVIIPSFLGIALIVWQYRRANLQDKSKFIYLFIGFFLFIVVAIFTNIIITGYIENDPNYNFYSRLGVFSVIFLVLFSGYAIVKHRLLDLKIIATEVLSLGILIFNLFQVLRSQNISELIVNLIVFAVMIFFVLMLVRSVENEVKRKEELQMMSDKLAEANDQLRRLDNSKSEFISIASHQLRTPITAIKGFMSLLLEGSYGKINAKQEDALNKAYTSNERLLNLVEDLLNVSRIESGRMEFKLTPTKVEDICQEVADTLMMKAKDRKLYLDYQIPKVALPELVIDGTKVREVISNMVDNAIKYTEKGGVTLRVEQVADAVRVVVSDTGIGIPKEELPYLFSKFSRGKDTTRLNTGGTGLGLYVGKAMIEQNGGKIWAESDGAGKGSRFIVELPIKQDEELLKRWGNN